MLEQAAERVQCTAANEFVRYQSAHTCCEHADMAEHAQGLCRFVFLCVRVLVFGVLSLSSPSGEKSSSHQQACSISIPCVLQQVVYCKMTPQIHKVTFKMGCTVVKIAHSFLYFLPLLEHPLTTFFAEDKEKFCRRLFHTHVNMCH